MTMGAYSWPPYDSPAAALSPHTEYTGDHHQSYYHHPSNYHHPYNSPGPVPLSRWPPPPNNAHGPQDLNSGGEPPSSGSGGDNSNSHNESSSSPTRGYPPAPIHPPHPQAHHHHHHIVGPYPYPPPPPHPHPYHAPHHSHPHQAQLPNHHQHPHQLPNHHNHNVGGGHQPGSWGQQYGNSGQPPPHYHQQHPHSHHQNHLHHYHRPYPAMDGRTGPSHMHPGRGSESGPGGSGSSSSEEVALLLPEDRPLLTDYFYLLIQQLRVCRFAEGDRKSRGGKRGNITVGYGGLECTHCAVTGIAGDHGGCCSAITPRKFFWTNVDRFSNSFAGIAEHVLKCINCPDEIRANLEDLKTRHREQMAKLPKGSQKEFFRRMWGRLHPDSEVGDGRIGEGGGGVHQQQRHPPGRSFSPPSVAALEGSGGGGGGTVVQSQRQNNPPPPPHHQRRLPLRSSSGEKHRAPTNYFAPSHDAGGNVGGGQHRHDHHHHRHHNHVHPPPSCPPGALVLPEDRPLLTDYFYFLNQQLKFCRFAEKDRKSRGGKRGNIVVGYGGLECRHCAAAASSSEDAAGAGPESTTPSCSAPRKFFWTNVDRFSNSFAGIADHVMKCINCPDHVKTALDDLKTYHRQQMAKLPKGSQKIFFQRLWSRLHPDGDGGDNDEAVVGAPSGGHHRERQSQQEEQQREDHPSEDSTEFHYAPRGTTTLEGQRKGQKPSSPPQERRVEGVGGGSTGEAEPEAGGDNDAGGAGRSNKDRHAEEELRGQDDVLPELPLVSFSFEASSEGRNKRKAEAEAAPTENNVKDASTHSVKKRAVDPKE